MKKKLIQPLVLLIFFIFNQCSNSPITPIAHRGVIDIRTWNFEKNGMIPLVGEWEFYWNEMIENSENRNNFLKNYNPKEIQYIPVPSEWQNYELDGKKLPASGYAMYRLKVLLKKGEAPLSFSLTDYCMAYKLYINGVLYYQVGKIGKSEKEMEPLLRYGSFDLPIDTPEEMEIVVLISNFHHARAGMWNKITIGHKSQIDSFDKFTIARNSLTFGCLCIMGVYHLFLYFIRKKDKTPLFFGIYCLLVSSRIVLMEERVLMELFPSIPFLIISKIEYLTFYSAVPIFLSFIYHLFPNEFSKKILYIIVSFSLIAILATIPSPLNFYAFYIFQAMEIITLVSVIYTSYVYVLAAIHKRPEALLVISGTLIFYGALVNDLMYGIGIIRTHHLVPYALLVFVFFQAIMLSQKFSRAFILSESQAIELIDKTNSLISANSELNNLKKELETKVEERTISLEEAYRKNYSEAKKIYLLEKEIAVQKERQSIFLNIHDHMGSNLVDLKNLFKILNSGSIVAQDFLDKTKLSIQKLEDSLRLKLQTMEDLEILKKDPLNGIRLLILRRYSIYDRDNNFFCEEKENFHARFFIPLYFSRGSVLPEPTISLKNT